MGNKMVKILVIDDNPDNLVIFRALIRDVSPDALVFTALNGKKGLELATQEDPDLIILDVIMPGMDGFEVCTRLKADKKLRDIPVVFVTALKGDKDNRVKALECGAEAFLSKPVDESELNAQIRAMLKIRAGNIQKRDEKELLAVLVEEKTRELKDANIKMKQLLEAVRLSEERFQLLFEKAPLGYQSLNIEGRFIDVNQKWLDTFGYNKEEVIGKWFGDFISPGYVDGFLKRFPVFMAQGYIHSEIEMLCKDGRKLFIAFDGKIGYNSFGDFKQTHCILQDITDQRKAEQALIESEERYRQLSEQSRTFTWEVDERGMYTFVDHVSEIVLGYHPEELILKKHFYDLFPDNERDKLKKTAFDTIESRDQFRDMENRAVTKSGAVVTLSTNGFPILNDDGSLRGYRGSDNDITIRKQTEEALRKSEERFRVVQEMSPDGFIILHPVYKEKGEIDEFICVYENKAFSRINQTDPREVIGKKLFKFFPAHMEEFLIKTCKHVAVTGESQIIDEVYAGEIDSGPVWLRFVIVSMGEDIAILTQDISERKCVEEASRLNAYMFRSLFDEMSSGAAIYNVINDGCYGKDYIIQDFNKAALKAERKEKTEVLGKSLYDLRPNIDRYGLIRIFRKVWKTGEPDFYPSKIYIDENFSNWYENHVYKLPTGEIVAIFDDVTEKKQAEEALKASETQYRRLFETAKDGIVILDYETGMIRDVNPFLVDLLGCEKEEFVDKVIWDIEAFKYLIPGQENYTELKSNAYFIYRDMPLKTANGSLIDIEFFSHTYLVNDKKLIQCNFRDITARKKAEKALYESERKNRSYVENAPEGVFILDDQGKYVEINKAATTITGYSREELLEMSFKDITAYESWECAQAGFEMLLETGAIKGEVQYLHKNGEKKWMSIDSVKLDDGYCMSFVSDITDKKKAESKLLYLSYHDHLTDIHNRRYFEQELKNLDTIENLPLSVIICDVNGLKLINDSFGHDSGDMLLKKTAETIKRVCRENDIAARSGGDEFVLLLPKTTADKSIEIANQIKELASKEKVNNIEVSVSFGCATKTSDKQSIIEIIANAENHMYRHKLYERSSIRSKTTDLIMKTLFEKSNREAMHSDRVSSICSAIAEKLNMDKGAVEKMRIAGLIHDIGKIGVPENILNKSGSLTMDERRDIERHPEIGWRLLSSTNEFSEVAQFVLCHHEKWDGSGYPNGLKGDIIPVESRIISVADAYDAMTRERSYRKGLSKEEAVQELTRCSGTQFDPNILNVFVNQILLDDRKE